MVVPAAFERRVHCAGLIALTLMCVFICVHQATTSPQQTNGHKSTPSPTSISRMLLTTLCSDKCTRNCRHYQTPFQQCYNGHSLFPNDSSWNSTVDSLDTPINATHFQRMFFEQGQSCRGNATDGFELPYDTCVGPFGAPRPWGSFQLLQQQ